MQMKELKKEKLEREISITVPVDYINAKTDEELQSIGNRVKIPGFRPGKVPAKILKQRYGKSVMGDVLEKTVQQKVNEALKERDERPAMRPNVEITSYDEGKPLEFKMSYEVLPEVKEIDFSKIKVESLTFEMPESEVQEGLERLAGQRTQYDAKSKTYKAKNGDAVKIDFKGFVDGEAFAGGAANGHTLELGSNSFIPGFEEQLVGTKAGDEVKVNVTFPKDYQSAALKGKDSVFEVKVHEVLASKPAEVNEAFAKELGLESLDALKKAVSEQMSKDYNEMARAKQKKALFDALDTECKFDTPKSMVKTEFDAIWQRIEQAKKQGDESFDKPEDELRAEYEAIAERRVRLGILLAEVGRKQELKVDQNELSRAVLDHARQFPGQEQAVFDFYQKNPERLTELSGPIIEEKAVDYILSKVKKTERKVSVEELLADDTAEGTDAKAKSSAKPKAKKAAAASKAESGDAKAAPKAKTSTTTAKKTKKTAESKKTA